mgnify:CR=1 FL=1
MKYNVVPRIEMGDGKQNAILFFPEERESNGDIGIYVKFGQHGNACHEYYTKNTRPPASVTEWKECLALIEEERTLGPSEDWGEAVIRTKLAY